MNIKINENFIKKRTSYFCIPDIRNIILLKFILSGIFNRHFRYKCPFCQNVNIKNHYYVDCADNEIAEWRNEFYIKLKEVTKKMDMRV